MSEKYRQIREAKRLTGREIADYQRALNEVIDLIPAESRPKVAKGYQRFLSVLKNIVPYISGKQAKILDVGCGPGIMSLVFKKMGYDVSAVDCWKKYPPTHANPSYASTRLNRERLEKHEVHTEDLDVAEEPLPFEDGNFDLVLFLEVIEHLHCSPKKVLAEIRRVLSEEGILLLTTPNLANLKNRLYVLAGRSNLHELSDYYHSDYFSGHVREYTLDEVKQMLTWEGFDIRHIELLNDLPILKARTFKLRPYTLIMGLYLLATTVVPKLRYYILVVSQKKGLSSTKKN